MQTCTSRSPQTDNHASTPPLSFVLAGCSSCHPTNSVEALKAAHTYKIKQNRIGATTNIYFSLLYMCHWVCKPAYLVLVPSQDELGGLQQEGHPV